MFAGECALPADERIDAIAIVTPNYLRAPILRDNLHVRPAWSKYRGMQTSDSVEPWSQ